MVWVTMKRGSSAQFIEKLCIVHGNMTTQEALQACEQDFFQQTDPTQKADAPTEMKMLPPGTTDGPEITSELDVNEVLAEAARILEEEKGQA